MKKLEVFNICSILYRNLLDQRNNLFYTSCTNELTGNINMYSLVYCPWVLHVLYINLICQCTVVS